jgi:quercetin dioxygenase-like cupin family protein
VHRFRVLLSIFTVLLLGVVVLSAQPFALAQEATPAGEEMMPEGLTFEPFGLGLGVTLPSSADLTAARVGFEPGAGFPFDASDPTGVMVIVESGALTVRVEEKNWTISRGAALSAAMATPEAMMDFSSVLEDVAPGEEVTLQAGDAAYVPGNLTGEVRNKGQVRAEGIVFLVSPAGAMTGATPTP